MAQRVSVVDVIIVIALLLIECFIVWSFSGWLFEWLYELRPELLSKSSNCVFKNCLGGFRISETANSNLISMNFELRFWIVVMWFGMLFSILKEGLYYWPLKTLGLDDNKGFASKFPLTIPFLEYDGSMCTLLLSFIIFRRFLE